MSRRSTSIAVVAVAELGVAAWAAWGLTARGHPVLRATAVAPTEVSVPTASPPATEPAATPTTQPAEQPARPAVESPPTRTPATTTPTTVAPAPTTTLSTGSAAAAIKAPGVTCGTDLSLAQSPDAPYNFLCRAGGVPVTWGSDRITMYVSGLSPAQTAVFPAALAQWEAAGHFTVVPVTNKADAEVTVTGVGLAAGQPGYTEDGYTTVTWACSPACHYVGASVQLDTQANLTVAAWTSTVLHELGHAAGLNHVSKQGEVMYPVLAPNPPVAYSTGDRAGLAVLTTERDG